MNEKRLPPRLMVLLVVLKGEKVYKVPIRSEIELDHLKDFNTLRRILTPLVQLYHGVGFDTRLTYDETTRTFSYKPYENWATRRSKEKLNKPKEPLLAD